MSKTSAILTHHPDRTYMVMQAVLAGLASVTIGGLSWAIWHRTDKVGAPIHSEKSPGLNIISNGTPPARIEVKSLDKVAQPPISLPALQAQEPLKPIASAPVPAPSPLPPAPIASLGTPLPPANASLAAPLNLSPATVPSAAQTLSAGKPLQNPQVLEAIEAGKLARKQGDMQASLEALRSADAREPNHPLILSQMALTYEEMGIRTKAMAAWRSIVAMGETNAGSFYTLAKSKLEDRDDALLDQVSAVKLGECQVIRDASSNKGERIAVRVPLVATPGAVIDPAQMDIHVYLFEDVNQGERIEQARATAPSNDWVSAPVDWKDSNEELVDVIYDLPTPKPEELREFGQRKFYGYVVKLFYQNKLVGEEAKPASLRDFSPARTGPAGLDGSLFPKQ